MDRKTVLVDLDNCVYPFTEMMAQVISQATDTREEPETLTKLYKSWEIWEDWDIPKGQFDWWWEQAITAGQMWRKGPAIDGAIRNLWKISDNEWSIHLCTSRLNKFRLHDRAVMSTVEWLADLGIPYRSLSFTEDKHAIKADAIIDDSPRNLLDHPAPLRILYPSPHNRKFAEVDDTGIVKLLDNPAVTPWDEITELLGNGEKT